MMQNILNISNFSTLQYSLSACNMCADEARNFIIDAIMAPLYNMIDNVKATVSGYVEKVMKIV